MHYNAHDSYITSLSILEAVVNLLGSWLNTKITMLDAEITFVAYELEKETVEINNKNILRVLVNCSRKDRQRWVVCSCADTH